MLKFDHVIHYVENACDVMKNLKEEEKLNVLYGGEHEKRGTYNTLLHFGLSYIEYLSINDISTFEDYGAININYSPFSTISKNGFKEGLSRVAIRTHDLERLSKYFAKKGLLVNGPIFLSRKKPNGQILQWELLFIDDPLSSLPLPFFIDWLESDEERYNTLVEENLIQKNNDSKIFHVAIAVKNLEDTTKKWSEWFCLETDEVRVDKNLNAKTQVLHLFGGNLLFAEPLGNGIVHEVLEKDSEKIFMIEIKNNQKMKRCKLINGSIYKIH